MLDITTKIVSQLGWWIHQNQLNLCL